MSRQHIDNLMSLAQVEENPVSKAWLVQAAAEILAMDHQIKSMNAHLSREKILDDCARTGASSQKGGIA